MRITIISLFTLLLISHAFCFNVSCSQKGNEIVFEITGKTYAKANLTLFLSKDGLQILGTQRNDVMLPYYYTVLVNESGTYTLEVIDHENSYAKSSINITIKPNQEVKQEEKKRVDTELAIIVAIVGLAILIYLLVSFLKLKSNKK